MTKIIGLTGGIGSGKTTIANYFKTAGIPVYIADDEARKLMQTPEIIEEVKTVFGTVIFEEGILNRQKMSEIVFNDPAKLKLLNSIIHPAVRKHFGNWVLKYENSPFVIYEAAILFESGGNTICSKVISVVAPLESRIERVMKRDRVTRDHVLKRIDNQWTDEQRVLKSDFVIENISPEIAKSEVVRILKILEN